MALTLGMVWVPQVAAQAVSSGEETPLALEPIVVTGTALPAPLSRTTASVTVLSREQIETQQAASVIDLLRQVPGLHIDQPGGRGGVSSVYLRGGDPNFTVVLIDGIQVNDPTNSRGGSFDFATLTPEALERIEVVRGPFSALYGSDALSGAINIITRKGHREASQSVEVAGGRFGYLHTVAQARGLLGEMDYALSGSFLDHGESTEESEFVNKTFHVNVGIPLVQTMELRWLLRYAASDSEAFPDDSGGPKFAVLRQVEERDIQELILGFTLAHEPFAWWAYSVQFGLYDRHEDVDSPGVAPGLRDPVGIPPSATDSDFLRQELTLSHRFSVAPRLSLAAGVQLKFEKGTSDGHLDIAGFPVPTRFELSRDVYAPFFEVQFNLLPGLLIQGSMRADFPQEFDTEVSPRLGASYTISATDTTLRASWGEGFKLPSFFALGHPIVGNPALVPETSQSVEVGVRQVLWDERLTLDVAYFHNEFTNLIDFAEGPPPRLVNRAEVTTAGVEMGLSVQPCPILGATAHLTYLETEIQGTDEDLRNRPRWRGGVAAWWRPSSVLEVHLKALVVGEVLDSSIPTGDRNLDAYARVDLAATWTLSSTWQLFFAIDNVFDADYKEGIGFPAPGIRPRGGVRARL